MYTPNRPCGVTRAIKRLIVRTTQNTSMRLVAARPSLELGADCHAPVRTTYAPPLMHRFHQTHWQWYIKCRSAAKGVAQPEHSKTPSVEAMRHHRDPMSGRNTRGERLLKRYNLLKRLSYKRRVLSALRRGIPARLQPFGHRLDGLLQRATDIFTRSIGNSTMSQQRRFADLPPYRTARSIRRSRSSGLGFEHSDPNHTKVEAEASV